MFLGDLKNIKEIKMLHPPLNFEMILDLFFCFEKFETFEELNLFVRHVPKNLKNEFVIRDPQNTYNCKIYAESEKNKKIPSV